MKNSIRNQYKYNIGETINNKIILKQIRMSNGLNKTNGLSRTCKGYFARCIYDGYEWESTEYNIIKRGCPVCSNKIVVTGVNDIATTHPELIPYFKYPKDTQTNTYSCIARVDMICPQCGFEKTRKIDGLSREGIRCPKCGDGTSIPEKFMLCILEQLNINFECQKLFKWSKNKRYDFYIDSCKVVIEINGSQHYMEMKNRGGKNLQEEQENDRIKKQLAKDNGIDNYIVIDCRYSEFNFMKNNIMHSKLAELFNLSKIDWFKCKEFALASRTKEACELWNNGIKTTKEISNIMKLSTTTVCSYLKKGKELSWCDYDAKESKIKKVLFVEENTIFNSADILSDYLSNKFLYKIYNYTIRLVCLNKQKNYRGLHFKYI